MLVESNGRMERETMEIKTMTKQEIKDTKDLVQVNDKTLLKDIDDLLHKLDATNQEQIYDIARNNLLVLKDKLQIYILKQKALESSLNELLEERKENK